MLHKKKEEGEDEAGRKEGEEEGEVRRIRRERSLSLLPHEASPFDGQAHASLLSLSLSPYLVRIRLATGATVRDGLEIDTAEQ
eukprot:evm.model.NODE_14133_length_1708_cov_13.228337.1